MSKSDVKPAPVPDLDDELWWSSLAEGELLVPLCRECGRAWMRPTPSCPHCGSLRWNYVASSGRGTLYSWFIAERALDPSFTDETPYVVGVVELDEGARVNARLVGKIPQIRVGLRLTIEVKRYRSGADVCPRLVAKVSADE